MMEEKVKELVLRKIEEIVGGKAEDDFYIGRIEDQGDKYKVTVDISYLYEYIDKEKIEKLLKAFDYAFIRVFYTDAIVKVEIEPNGNKLNYKDELVDYKDFQAKLVVYVKKQN